MERLVPVAAAEPIVRTGGSSGLRLTAYALLGLALAAGAWVRFNDQIARLAPELAAPGSLVPQTGQVRALIELQMVPQGASEAMVAQMGLPVGQAALLIQALKRGRMRLVTMPLIDASTAGLGDGSAGHSIEVSAGGYSNIVQLTRSVVAVPLPIGPAGEVTFRGLSSDSVRIGALGLSGPLRLPNLRAGQAISVGVIAQ